MGPRSDEIPCTSCAGSGYRSGDEQCFTCRGTGWIRQSFPGPQPSRGGGGASGSSCFIATAAYGTPVAAQVRILRAYRDTSLRTHRFGRGFIALYERCSPPLARWIAPRPRLRRLARLLIAPLARHARRAGISPAKKKGTTP